MMKKHRQNFVWGLSVLAFLLGILTLFLAGIFLMNAFGLVLDGFRLNRYICFVFGLMFLAASFFWFNQSEWKKFLRKRKLKNKQKNV